MTETESTMSTERRKFPRKKPEQLSYINLESENGGMLLDLSEGGVGFHAVTPIDASIEKLRFWFSVKSIDRIDAEGKIVWTDESHKSGGVRFLNLDDMSQKKIRAWVRAEQIEEQASALAPAAARPAASSAQPPSDFDAKAEEIISVAEAALGSGAHGGQPPVIAASAGFGAADLDPLPCNSAVSAVSRPVNSISSAVPLSGASVASLENSRRLKITPAGIQPDLNAKPADGGSGQQSRRFSILFDEGDPDDEEPIDRRRVFAPFPQRQSQMGVVFGTLGVLALLAGGVYTYLYHDRVGAFLESLGSRMTQSRQASQSPQTVAAAPPTTTNPPPVSQASPPTSSTVDPSAMPTNAPPTANSASQAPANANTTAAPASDANSAGMSPLNQPTNSGTAGDKSGAPNGDTPEKTPADPSGAVPKAPASSASVDFKPEPRRSSALQQPASASNRMPMPGEPDEGGAEQLAAARKLLGSSASRSDTARGVQLLWSAIEKGNLEAEVELANLYISGVGVPKNCTQARVLLQSAAKRDSSEALRRLQELRRGSCP